MRREDESAVGAGRRPGHVVWRGKVQLKCGDGRKLLTWLLWVAPLSEGRALIAYLFGRGLAGGLVIFLLFLVAAKS